MPADANLHACTSGLDGVDTPYLDFRMPTRALMLLRVLKLGANIKKSPDASTPCRRVCSYADFKGTAKKLRMKHGDESMEHLLEIFSGLGAVKWFPGVTKDLVVLDPQWLLDSVSCLIREHHGHHPQLLQTLKQDKHALSLLHKGDVQNGIFPAELLDYIWSSHKAEYKALGGQPMELAALKKILEHFGLICRVQLPEDADTAREDKKDSREYYIVPPLLPDSIPTDSHISEYLKYPNAKKFTCLCDFSKSKWLQQSVFQRLVCSIVLSLRGVLPVTHLMVTQRAAYMYAGDAVLSLRLLAERWQIKAQTVNCDDCPHSSQWMLRLVMVNLKRVLQVFPKPIPHQVFLSAGDELLVKLSDLKRANNMVNVVSTAANAAPAGPKRMQAKRLKENWLRDPQKCNLDCCLQSPADVCASITGAWLSTH